MTFSLRASEGAHCALPGVSRPSRFRRLTASVGLVSCATAAFVAFGSLAAQAGTHHHDDARPSSHTHAKHHEASDDHASHSTKRHPALVKVSTAKLRATPGTTGKTTALLDAGRSAVVIGRKEGWVQLKLDSGRKGWVRHDLLDVAKTTVRDHDSREDDRSERHTSRHDSHDSESEVSSVSRKHSDHHSTSSRRVTEIADAHAAEHRSTLRHAEYTERAEHAENVRHQHAVAALAAAATATAHHNHRVVHSLVAVATPAPKPIHVTAAPPSRTISALPDSSENDGETLADGEAGTPTTSNRSHDEIRPTNVANMVSVVRNSSNPRGERVVRKALSYRGTPYRMGATGNGAFDCSGFTMYLFGKEGSSLPRTAAEQYERGQAVAKDQLQLGDLVFFRNTYKNGISHVGVYIGNNSFVHAAGSGRGVRIDSLSGSFYINHWAGARRPH